MIRDAIVLNLWIRWFAVFAAVCTASVPVIYSRSRWYRSWLGQLFMLQSISFAMAMGLFALLLFWVSADTTFVFVATALAMIFVSTTTIAMGFLIFKMNYPRGNGKHAHAHE